MWGARAFVDTRGGYATLDLLPDQQLFRGEKSHILALQARLDEDALLELRRCVARYEPEMTNGRSRSIVMILRIGWRLLASPQGSYGYLYLVAFPYAATAQGGEQRS